MGIFSWIILGLIAGVLAKWIMPGKDDLGFIITILLGIAGAFVGGFLGSLVGLGSTDELSIGSILTATMGALLLLFLYRQFKQKSS
ncbi:MAG: GlsB/YeaQ/YmgE family stress response membrane protein [Gammaproteobacteria bacterium]|nr:GlsB/YeaQ/YmgE family stress response membrane protein [Gammaproteobacteria bacterium]